MRPNVRAKATAKADAAWPRKDNLHDAWSGQAVAAVAGRRLSDRLGSAVSEGTLQTASGSTQRESLQARTKSYRRCAGGLRNAYAAPTRKKWAEEEATTGSQMRSGVTHPKRARLPAEDREQDRTEQRSGAAGLAGKASGAGRPRAKPAVLHGT